jgi:hypothetical protein
VSSDVARSAVIAVIAVVGLVVCLTAAELLDVKWLLWPGIACFLVALIAAEFGWWGRQALTIAIAILALIIAAAFISSQL